MFKLGPSSFCLRVYVRECFFQLTALCFFFSLGLTPIQIPPRDHQLSTEHPEEREGPVPGFSGSRLSGYRCARRDPHIHVTDNGYNPHVSAL